MVCAAKRCRQYTGMSGAYVGEGGGRLVFNAWNKNNKENHLFCCRRGMGSTMHPARLLTLIELILKTAK